ncbi:uncharacterized protein LOC128982422 [Macrosteles quadrilineatus]|uniref:uncharacterized protein LOC128982422 n=1 Tax=Macrosteles quadrilineatus TaxID=74068 RepID=UPI0023E094E5|nr:uncharacterized protein LOC128982422 [Macrosteles quadrilineatus]
MALFTIFINDLVQHLDSNVLLFADDAKIFREISHVRDCEALQNSIDLLSVWCQMNEMSLNVSKCSVVTFTRSNNPIIHPYKLADQQLQRSSKVKDLGIILSPDLNPQEHINYICKKANSALNFITRVSHDRFSVSALVTLYIHLVRPILEFSSTVWNPYQSGQIARLENTQSRFVRLVGLRLGMQYRAVPVHDLQLQLNLLPLSTRREVNDVLFLKKLITSSIDAPDLLLELDFRTSRSLRHTQLFARRQYSTQYMYHSALPRLQRLANNLPGQLDLFSMNNETFKKKLVSSLRSS